MADTLTGRRKKQTVAEVATGRRAKLRKSAIADQQTPETTGSLIYGFGAPEATDVGGLAAKGLTRRAAGTVAGSVSGALGAAAPALMAPPVSVAAKRKKAGKYLNRG